MEVGGWINGEPTSQFAMLDDKENASMSSDERARGSNTVGEPFGFDARWTAAQLAEAHRLVDGWNAVPESVDVALLNRISFGLTYCLKYRAFTCYSQHLDAWAFRWEVADLCGRVFPSAWVPMDKLSHISTRTFPDRLAVIEAGWPGAMSVPIHLHDEAHGLVLTDGNHRLTVARAHGEAAVLAVVAPFCGPWVEARDREERVFAAVRESA